MTALIVNFAGLGDGLIEVPFLKNMSVVAPYLKWYHTGGTVFDDSSFVNALGSVQFQGTVPSQWRNFAASDWPEILAFVTAAKVDLIINFRHLGPTFDPGYFAFKETHAQHLEFWNCDFISRQCLPENIRTPLCKMLSAHGVVDSSLSLVTLHAFLQKRTRSRPPRGIAVNIHSANALKLWPNWKWERLCLELAIDENLIVFAGRGDAERRRACWLVHRIENRYPGRAALVKTADVIDALNLVSGAKCVVSVDSWTVHAAAGLGVRAVGIYIVTSGVTWGGAADGSACIESEHLSRCEKFNASIGLCVNDRRACPIIEKEGDGIQVEDVLTLVRAALG